MRKLIPTVMDLSVFFVLKYTGYVVVKKCGFYSQPIIIMATAKIFSPSVVGAMLPKPILVKLVMVKYNDVM